MLAPGSPPEVADHVEVECQFPEATEYRSDPNPAMVENDRITARNNFLQERLDLIIIEQV